MRDNSFSHQRIFARHVHTDKISCVFVGVKERIDFSSGRFSLLHGFETPVGRISDI